jgi:hypothetical protein
MTVLWEPGVAGLFVFPALVIYPPLQKSPGSKFLPSRWIAERYDRWPDQSLHSTSGMPAAPAGENAAFAGKSRLLTRIADRKGYPCLTSKKKRVYVVTYRHSGGELFEKSPQRRPNVNNL